MNGLYLYCQKCSNYTGGGDCSCGWRNRYLSEEQPPMEEVSREQLLEELSCRLSHYNPREFENVLDQLRSDYVRD